MNYNLIVALIPILMFTEYYLKIIQWKLYYKIYHQHVSIQNLNFEIPKLLNIQYFLLILAISALNYFVFNIEYFLVPIVTFFLPYANPQNIMTGIEFDTMKHVLAGFDLILFSLPISYRVFNILTYLYLNKYPNQIIGKINISLDMSYKMSLFFYLVASIPLIISSIILHELFLYGGLIAVLYLVIGQFFYPRQFA